MPTGIEAIDNWSRVIFLWTFDHHILSGILIATPIVFWIILGLLYIIANGMVIESKYGDSWIVSWIVMSIYIFIPIIYLYTVGYIGYLTLG